MSGAIADFKKGDVVNVRSNGRWQKEPREIVSTQYTTTAGRTYSFNNGDIVPEKDVRKHKGA